MTGLGRPPRRDLRPRLPGAAEPARRRLMARSLPRRSPDRAAWVAAALNLWRRAIWATTEAMLAARRMRDAVTVELEDAWMVLNR